MTHDLARRVTALAVILPLVISTLPVRAIAAQQGAATAPARDTGDPFAVLLSLDTTAANISPADWSEYRRAERLADGIDAAFAVVRDEIGFEPYAGVLRGASGTYATRAGNAADRALLLAELLNLRGTKTRFAIGTLDPQHRDRLLARVFEAPPGRSQPAGEPNGLNQRILSRAARDYGRLRGALGDRLPPVTEPARTQLLADMDPHVWIQAASGRGWVDLDPSFTDARPGQTWGALRQTVDRLPDDLYQRITIRVVAEHLSSGTLTSKPLLQVTRNSVDLNHVQIALVQTQTEGVGGLGGAIGQALGKKSEDWRPLLWIAGEFVPGAPVNIAASTFVGEWLEFELIGPGGWREVTRRPLADRGDAAWRSAAALRPDGLRPLERNDSGPLDMQAVHNIWLSGSQHDLSDYIEGLEELLLDASAKAAGTAPAVGADDFGSQFWPFAMHNLSAMLWTDHVALPLVNDTPGVRVYHDSPRIAVFSTGPSGRDDLRIATDLRRDHVRGVAREGGERTLAEKKLRFGVLQGALEHEFMHELAVASEGSAAGVASTSARLTDPALSVLTRASIATLTGQGSATALVRRALGRDAMVVTAPADLDARDAWWEIDARTGDTHAVGGPGLHWMEWRGKGIKQPNQPGKAFDARPRAEQVAERNRRFYEEIARRNRENPGRLAKDPPRKVSSPYRSARGGGGQEYGVLLAVVTIASSMAMWALSAWLEAKIYQEISIVARWIVDGGFRRAIGR